MPLLGSHAVCFAISAFAVDPTRTVSQYLYDSWGIERGLPGGSITAIAQTSDGYLWIGTNKGLVRFDGFSFRQFERAHPDPILIGPVRSLLVDASDNLWILLQNTQVFHYRDGNFELIRGQAENGTTAMARGQSGSVLLSSLPLGTLTFRDNRFRTLSSASLPADAAVAANGETPEQRSAPFSWNWHDRLIVSRPSRHWSSSMAQTDDGKIWLGTERRGLFYLQADRIFSASMGRVDTNINCLLPLQNSELWVGTAKGILRWNGTRLTSAGVPTSLRNLDVLSILRDRDSNIWVGTSRGLFRYNANGVSLLSTHPGPVAALFEDREGNIWIGAARGLERLRDSAFVTYSLPNLKSQSMGPLHVDSGGRTWVAPIEGGLRWLKEEKAGLSLPMGSPTMSSTPLRALAKMMSGSDDNRADSRICATSAICLQPRPTRKQTALHKTACTRSIEVVMDNLVRDPQSWCKPIQERPLHKLHDARWVSCEHHILDCRRP